MSHVIGIFCAIVSPEIILVWPLWVANLSSTFSTHQKDLQFRQSLDVDNMTSLSYFGGVMWLGVHSTARSAQTVLENSQPSRCRSILIILIRLELAFIWVSSLTLVTYNLQKRQVIYKISHFVPPSGNFLAIRLVVSKIFRGHGALTSDQQQNMDIITRGERLLKIFDFSFSADRFKLIRGWQ